MANEEHLAILRRGVDVWNAWRLAHSEIRPELEGANLSKTDLHDANLQVANMRSANLQEADLFRVNLRNADLRDTDLRDADLQRANLHNADLQRANLQRANLQEVNFLAANLQEADLRGANVQEGNLHQAYLQEAYLLGADFHRAHLQEANLLNARVGRTDFADVDLSEVQGLETLQHYGPSTIGTDTLYKSKGKIPEAFLQGCGVPDSLIEYLPSLIGAMEPIQYYSCFISYSSKDEAFAKRLHERMRAERLRVWFAPEDMKGGQKFYDQIEQAIQLYDRLLLVLSPHSIESDWVTTEIYNARQSEIRENRRKLFPIRLVDMNTLKAWKCPDADTGKDLAREVREYHIPDFSNWKDHDAFEVAFSRLLRDLRAAEHNQKQT